MKTVQVLSYMVPHILAGKIMDLGLKELRKPLLHLHTQFNEEIPYDTIDMDFMNENQAAHGDREWGHIVTRMGIERKVVVGYWADPEAQGKNRIMAACGSRSRGKQPYPCNACS